MQVKPMIMAGFEAVETRIIVVRGQLREKAENYLDICKISIRVNSQVWWGTGSICSKPSGLTLRQGLDAGRQTDEK